MMYLFALGFNELVSYFGNDIYLPALPRIMSDFGLNESSAQLSLFVWIVGIPIFQLVFSHYHKINKRNIILASNLLLVVSSLVCFYTSNYMIFLGMRFIQSASVAAMTTIGYALVYEKFGENEGARLIGLLGSITIMGPALGPPLGSLILNFQSWPFIFLTLAILGLIASAWTHFSITHYHTNNATVFSQPKSRSPLLFYLLIFCACQILIPLVLWICESPIILMIEHKMNETTYGLIMFGIFSAYAVGSILMSQIANRIHSYRLLHITFPMYAFFTCLLILSQNITHKLILITLLMFLSPILSNRLARYIVLLRIHVLEKSLGVFSFFYSVAAILAGGISTFTSFHTINFMGWVIGGHIALAYITFWAISQFSDFKRIQ
jgi:MFS family permease